MHVSQGHLDALVELYAQKSHEERDGLPFAFTAVTSEQGEGAALGVAEANLRGYSPVPDAWASGTYTEMTALADRLNEDLLSPEEATRVIISTMGGIAYARVKAGAKDEIQVGDRIHFSAPTRNGRPSATRRVVGMRGDRVLVRFHGHSDFAVRPDEIIAHYPAS